MVVFVIHCCVFIKSFIALSILDSIHDEHPIAKCQVSCICAGLMHSQPSTSLLTRVSSFHQTSTQFCLSTCPNDKSASVKVFQAHSSQSFHCNRVKSFFSFKHSRRHPYQSRKSNRISFEVSSSMSSPMGLCQHQGRNRSSFHSYKQRSKVNSISSSPRESRTTHMHCYVQSDVDQNNNQAEHHY